MTALVKNIIGVKPTPAATETGPSEPVVKFLTVDEESAGQRLDNFLFRNLKGVPKTHVYRIIRSGEVRINKGRAHAETRIESGDVLRLPPVRVSPRIEENASRPAPARQFSILLEDDALLAIDKPAGVAVHGGSGVSFGVIEQLRTARPTAKFLELVHRLDRDTSGILLVAKKRSALTALQEQFRERETGKTYLALVDGTWPANKKVLDAPLAKYLLPGNDGTPEAGERRVRVVAKDHPDAMRAVTLVRVIARFTLPGDAAPVSLLAVTIKTGRTHQIRVHLASAGHAIAGDDKYGESDRQRALTKLGLKRMFLHAWRLQFTHPTSGERVSLQTDLPPELHALMPPSALDALARHPTPDIRHMTDSIDSHASSPRRFDLIAFDWDGTLYDSTRLIVRCIQAAVVDVGGAKPSEDDAAWVIGLGLAEALARAAPDVPKEKYVELGARYRYHYVQHQDDLVLFDGVLPMLDALRSRGHKLAVATGKSRRGLNDALSTVALRDRFDASRTADETAGKPHPRMLLELMEELDVAPPTHFDDR